MIGPLAYYERVSAHTGRPEAVAPVRARGTIVRGLVELYAHSSRFCGVVVRLGCLLQNRQDST